MESDRIPLNLILRYPLINVYKTSSSINYVGKIDIKGKLHPIDVELTGKILKDNVKNEPLKFNDIESYLDALADVETKDESFDTVEASKVLRECHEFQNFYLNLRSFELSNDLTSVTIATADTDGREHRVRFKISPGNECFSFDEYDLPDTRLSSTRSSSLIHLFGQFQNALESFQGYFRTMEVLDSSAEIIAPVEPSRKDRYRRIWLDDDASVVVTIDPFGSYPEFVFFGSTAVVDVYRSRLNENLNDWDPNGDAPNEIVKLLGLVEFPKKMKVDSAEELLRGDGDCCICFQADYGGKLPDIVCDNRSCRQPFHRECIYEWLLSINSRRVFNEIKGPCPNCEKVIACPL